MIPSCGQDSNQQSFLLSNHQTSAAQCLFFSYPGTGGEQKEVQVSKQEAKLLIEDFDPSKEYNFKIIAVSGGQQSKPLQAKHEGKRLSLSRIFNPQWYDSPDE